MSGNIITRHIFDKNNDITQFSTFKMKKLNISIWVSTMVYETLTKRTFTSGYRLLHPTYK